MLRRWSQPEPEVPTSSMADVAFLLMVFFLVTTVFAETQGLEFNIPETDEAPATTIERAVHVRLDQAGRPWLDDREIARDALPTTLAAHLLPRLARRPDVPVIVTYERSSPYGALVETYDALRRVEQAARDAGYLPRHRGLRVAIPSVGEVEALKARFGEARFG